MDTYDSGKITELHRLSWNTSEAPLLFIVIPDQILIFDNYCIPDKNPQNLQLKGLIEKILLIEDFNEQDKLRKYHRLQFEVGNFWKQNTSRFNVKNRLDTVLIDNLKLIRKEIIENILIRDRQIAIDSVIPIVHNLLGRSILIKYLEERKDNEGRTVFPLSFFSSFLKGADCYSAILGDKAATYRLFSEIETHFHGNIFPIYEEELCIITSDDLHLLKRFIDGNVDLKNAQFTFWPLYSFNVIPIQLISSIYELFFHLQENKAKNGTYYTPYHLVEILVDEVLPWEEPYTTRKILDPACGSGIFLVEIYRRLIAQLLSKNKTDSIKSDELIDLLKTSIFGVDLNTEAIKIASFSLCLTLCDFLEPRTIWEELEFPDLIEGNLFPTDFFSNSSFVNHRFDIIIGNPPWESRLSIPAAEYVRRNSINIGDKQIAQAFSWRAADFVRMDGLVCFLMPSKGLLFNRSERNKAYRQKFFNTFNILTIINFSAFRKILFEHASGPATGIIYSINKKEDRKVILYCTPKPQYTVEDRRRFFIEPLDISPIPIDLIGNDYIWKIAMWGGPRDFDLISKIRTNGEPLESYLSMNGMFKAEGFKKGNKKKQCKELLLYPMVKTIDMSPYILDTEGLEKIEEDGFECTVERNRVIFNSPHLLIKQSPVKWRFVAAYLDFNAVFNHSILGIHGESKILKYICLIINSKIFSYYQLMTSRRWMVERDELESSEILSMPIPVPSEDELNKAIMFYDQMSRISEQLFTNEQKRIEQFVFDLYRLTNYEIEIVNDSLNYIYDSFSKKSKSIAFNLPNSPDFELYANTLSDVLGNSLSISSRVRCRVYSSNSPLTIAEVSFESQIGDQYTISRNFNDVDLLLERLDELLIHEQSQSVYIRRNVRVYSGSKIFIIKPTQRKYWNYSMACRDADEIYIDIMRKWRADNE